jgi:hypothetical protein
MIRRLAHSYDSGGVCQEFLPVPNSGDSMLLRMKRYSRWGVCEDFNKTVGGINSSITATSARLEFQTDNSPPLGLYMELHRRGFELEAMYFELAEGFCGHVRGNSVRHFTIQDDDIRVIRQNVDAILVDDLHLEGIYGAPSSNPLPQVAPRHATTWLQTFDLESYVEENLHDRSLWECEIVTNRRGAL